MNSTIRPLHRRMARGLSATALLAAAMFAMAGHAAQPRAPDTEELSVSVGSWLCERYLPAVGVSGAGARRIVDAVEPFALGYVAGVADATGRALPDTAEVERRILALLAEGCRVDAGRAIRDVTLLAGRTMTEPGAVVASPGAPHPGPGRSACAAWLSARAGTGAPREDNWAEGYVNARFERAGRGLIPTARNRARVLERVSEACAATPAATVREAARRAAEQTLAASGTSG
jgi:hypothetical protein